MKSDSINFFSKFVQMGEIVLQIISFQKREYLFQPCAEMQSRILQCPVMGDEVQAFNLGVTREVNNLGAKVLIQLFLQLICTQQQKRNKSQYHSDTNSKQNNGDLEGPTEFWKE
jgi:hypothetical protein